MNDIILIDFMRAALLIDLPSLVLLIKCLRKVEYSDSGSFAKFKTPNIQIVRIYQNYCVKIALRKYNEGPKQKCFVL